MSEVTPQEEAVLDHLAAAWNVFVKLPNQHPMAYEEFAHAIHQNMGEKPLPLGIGRKALSPFVVV